MNFISSFIVVSSFFLISSATFAGGNLSNGSLYKYCKPYSDRAFQAETQDDLTCVMYFTGAVNSLAYICTVLQSERYSALPDHLTSPTKSVFAVSPEFEIKPIIQSYVNDMKMKPSDWKYSSTSDIMEHAKAMYPCS